MKRDILCSSCAKKSRELMINLPPEENVKHINGKAYRGYQCDLCGRTITANDKCTARSIWVNDDINSYVIWEYEYLHINHF